MQNKTAELTNKYIHSPHRINKANLKYHKRVMSSTITFDHPSFHAHQTKELSFDEYLKEGSYYEEKHFTVDSNKLMDILGDVLLFGYYKCVERKHEYVIELSLIFEQIDDVILITVLINDDFVKKIQLNKYEKSRMIYHILKYESPSSVDEYAYLDLDLDTLKFFALMLVCVYQTME